MVSWLLNRNSSLTPYLRSEKSEMAPLFDAIDWQMDWDDEETELSTAVGPDTRNACETASNGSDNTPKLPVRIVSGK